MRNFSHARFVLKHGVKVLFEISPHDPKGFAFKQVSVFCGFIGLTSSGDGEGVGFIESYIEIIRIDLRWRF